MLYATKLGLPHKGSAKHVWSVPSCSTHINVEHRIDVATGPQWGALKIDPAETFCRFLKKRQKCCRS